MGLFGGIGKALKGIDWGNAMAGLQSAGAIAQGDYGAAAQIQGYRRRERDEQSEAEAKRAQAEQAVAALVRQGIPDADARALVSSGAADTVLAQRHGQPADNEFTRTLRAAGIDPAGPDGQALYRQRAATMASPAPQMTGSPERGYTWNTPPPPQVPGLTGAPPPPPPQPQQAQQGGQVINTEMYRGAVNGLGAPEAASWAQRNNIIVAVRSPQEARQLPSGTRIRLPDGTEGRVP